MKQLATMDDITNLKEDLMDIKDSMDNLLTRVIALEYTAQDLQRLVDSIKVSPPTSTRINYTPYWAGIAADWTPEIADVQPRTWTLNEDGSVSWN